MNVPEVTAVAKPALLDEFSASYSLIPLIDDELVTVPPLSCAVSNLSTCSRLPLSAPLPSVVTPLSVTVPVVELSV